MVMNMVALWACCFRPTLLGGGRVDGFRGTAPLELITLDNPEHQSGPAVIRGGKLPYDPALRGGIGLIHPAGDCLSDKLLDIIGSGSMKEWPFDWEEVRVKEDICTETRLCSPLLPPPV